MVISNVCFGRIVIIQGWIFINRGIKLFNTRQNQEDIL